MSGSARLGINCALSTFHSWRIEHLFTELMKNEIFSSDPRNQQESLQSNLLLVICLFKKFNVTMV